MERSALGTTPLPPPTSPRWARTTDHLAAVVDAGSFRIAARSDETLGVVSSRAPSLRVPGERDLLSARLADGAGGDAAGRDAEFGDERDRAEQEPRRVAGSASGADGGNRTSLGFGVVRCVIRSSFRTYDEAGGRSLDVALAVENIDADKVCAERGADEGARSEGSHPVSGSPS